MDALINFIETQPLFAFIGLLVVLVLLRLFGIGKKIIIWGAILIMAGGSVFIAQTMG